MAHSHIVPGETNVRSRLTAQQLWAAMHFARLCDEREQTLLAFDNVDFPHRSYAMAAVKFSGAFLESLVNDIYSEAADPFMVANSPRMKPLAPSVIAGLAAEWNATEAANKFKPVLDKFSMALKIAGAPRFDRGAKPYQPTADLVELRNRLVHFKPGWETSRAPAEMAVRLGNKIPENRQPIGLPWFPNRCLGSGCAAWACETVQAFANEWLDRMNIPRTYEAEIASFGAA